MGKTFKKITQGYQSFRKKYASGDNSIMSELAHHGQQPKIMMISCCDSRVDPALILQCDPGDLFIARNVANIVPPYQNDGMFHGTSAALEFAVRHLKVKHLVILGHSQCGGMEALLKNKTESDFIHQWVSIINIDSTTAENTDELGKQALLYSYENCLTFPWIKERIKAGDLSIHLWFFDIETATISAYDRQQKKFSALSPD